jgi:hypothetical protein
MFQFYDNEKKEQTLISLEDAFRMFKADVNEEAEDVSKDFYEAYNLLKEDITK